jgi:NADH-quinone oxidoreductase subunit G
MKKIRISINETPVHCEEGQTILEVCQSQAIEIPTLCYNKNLSSTGACRMCLVEVNGHGKLQTSCGVPVTEGMEIYTNTKKVEMARRGTLDFLLLDHPLECPLCDKSGECALQDQSFVYGEGQGLSTEHKRVVENQEFGPLIKTAMNRCIHCNLCVQFAEEVAGTSEIGAFGRGEDMEIRALKGLVTSELSGNVIDVCPSGALLSKPFKGRAKSWEMETVETIDVMDAVGSSIRVQVRDGEIMGIQPRDNEWISDKTRFSHDGLCCQRLDQPYIRIEGKLQPSSWIDAFKVVVKKMTSFKPSEMAFLTGDLVDVETVYVLRQLLDKMGVPHRDCREAGQYMPMGARGNYLFNTTIQGIKKADACLIVGSNPRLEAPVLNAHLLKRFKQGNFPVAVVGEKVDLTYGYTHLDANALVLKEILKEMHPFTEVLKIAKNPMIIVGNKVLSNLEGESIYGACRAIATQFNMIREDWNGFNVLHMAAGRVGALDAGFVPLKDGYDTAGILRAAKTGHLKLLYLVGVDNIPFEGLEDTFVIYQGHHGDAGANKADVIFPGLAYTEKKALYVNTEGRLQEAQKIVEGPGEAKEDWKIIRGLSEVVGHKLPYNTREEILAELSIPESSPMSKDVEYPEITRGFMKETDENFYRTNVICRASSTMAQCSVELVREKIKEKARAYLEGVA